jgi:hypothetical protein
MHHLFTHEHIVADYYPDPALTPTCGALGHILKHQLHVAAGAKRWCCNAQWNPLNTLLYGL